MMTIKQKLEWLRKYVDPNLPDIYAIKDFIPNGCGPETWRSKPLRFLLNWLGWGVDLNPCGDLHDYRFWCGGSWDDFQTANEELRRSILAWLQCVSRWHVLLRWRIRRRAEEYHWAVCNFGDEHFNFRAMAGGFNAFSRPKAQ